MLADSNSVGKQVGNYSIMSKLNGGSFGDVYLGKHIIFESVAAIKLLHTHLFSKEQRDQFINEAKLLYKLDHPSILRVIDSGFQNNAPYIVIEYAARGSLKDYLKQQSHKPLPLEDALKIISTIGQALHYAHQKNIVHRDLKPANILFNDQGDALLADFGIAVILSSAHTQLIGTGGTPAYMAPEQFEGLVSTRSDQYALGCIAYELITGKRPFKMEAGQIEAMWYQHAKISPAPPTSIIPGIPSYIERAILKVMAKDRMKRHANILAFISALEQNNTEEQWQIDINQYIDVQRYDEALNLLERAIAINPEDSTLYGQKGFVLNNLKRYNEALVALDQAIHLNANDSFFFNQKAYALNSLERYEEALIVLNKAIRLNTHDAVALKRKGFALNQLRRHQDALASLEQAILLDPDDSYLYGQKGYALNSLGRYQEALETLEQGISRDPTDNYLHSLKGYAITGLKR